MKYENPETKIIREQKKYIQILEEQLAVYKEQIKVKKTISELLDIVASILPGKAKRRRM